MENTKKFIRKSTNEMRKIISENPQVVIDEINTYIADNKIKSITAEWDNSPFREKYNSYSSFSNVVREFGYQYSQKDKMFIKSVEVENQQEENTSSELTEILKFYNKEKYDCENRTIRIDKATYEEFNSLASQFNMPKSELNTLMYKKFNRELKEALSKIG